MAAEPIHLFATLLATGHGPVQRAFIDLGSAQIKGERKGEALDPSLRFVHDIQTHIEADCGSAAEAWSECIKKSGGRDQCQDRLQALFNCAISKTGARVEYAEELAPNGKTTTENWKALRALSKKNRS